MIFIEEIIQHVQSTIEEEDDPLVDETDELIPETREETVKRAVQLTLDFLHDEGMIDGEIL